MRQQRFRDDIGAFISQLHSIWTTPLADMEGGVEKASSVDFFSYDLMSWHMAWRCGLGTWVSVPVQLSHTNLCHRTATVY
jgi:hypothetical protein